MQMLNIYKFNNAIIFIVLIFLLFDGIRSNLKISALLTLMREVAIFYLILYSVSHFSLKRNIFTKSLLYFLLYHTFIVWFSLINSGPITWSFVIKPYEFLGAIHVFSNYSTLTNKKVSCLVKQIINISVVFSVLNVVMYFVPLPIWNRTDFWWGRISCGYPTMDVITQNYSLILLLFFPLRSLSNGKKLLYATVIVTGIMLSFSGTGTLLLLLIFIAKLLFGTQNKKKVLTYSLVSLFVMSITLLPFLKETFQKEYEMGTYLLENKWHSLIGVDDGNINTLQMRAEQLEKAQKKQNGIIAKVFGIGLNYATNDGKIMNKYSDALFIENEFNLLSVCYGYLGTCLYCCFIINLFIYCIYKINNRQKKFFSLLGLTVFVCNNYTLLPLILFPNYIGFAIIYSMVRNSNNTLTLKNENSIRL